MIFTRILKITNMKKYYLLIFVLIFSSSLLIAQDKKVIKGKKVYSTSGGEWIFSTGTLANNNNVIRWSPVFNFQNLINVDESENFGWFTGLNLRNVGFIYDESSSVRKKVRNYNIGIPVGFKFGNLEDRFLFGGYEIEFAVNYRERTFIDERRVDRFSVWFSDRVNTVQHALFVGIALPKGTSIKAKYYLTSFFNSNFTEGNSQGNPVRPYEGLNANIFYVSLNFNLFRNLEFNNFD
jgi:hypothetical protein